MEAWLWILYLYTQICWNIFLYTETSFFSWKEDQEHLTVCEGTKISEEMPTSEELVNFPNSVIEKSKKNECK